VNQPCEEDGSKATGNQSQAECHGKRSKYIKYMKIISKSVTVIEAEKFYKLSTTIAPNVTKKKNQLKCIAMTAGIFKYEFDFALNL
jgi:hypothetical protein